MNLSVLGQTPTLEELAAMVGPAPSNSPTPSWERALVSLGQSLGGHINSTPFMQVADSGDWQGAGETMADILMRDVLGRDPETGAQGLPGVGLAGIVSKKPLTYFRAETPGSTKRIKTGSSDWDSHTFVATSPEPIKYYGDQLYEVTTQPSLKLLRETGKGSGPFRSLMKGVTRNQSFLDYYSEAARRAKAAGYDVVEFERQGDIGTVIFNPQNIASKTPIDWPPGLKGR